LRFGLPSKRRLINLWSAKRPDIVHVATEGPLGWSAVAAARKLHLPVTSSFHTNFQSYTQHYGFGLLKSPIESYLRKLHNHTQLTMVPTRELMHDLHNRGYTNVRLLSRGVASDLFNPNKRSTELRERWGAGTDDVVVLLVGRLAKEKNVGLVISAFRAIQRVKPSAKLVFVGDGPLRQVLQSSCPDAFFAGVQKGEALAAHYASGDLFLFSSLTETFGNVVPEALASGLALVSFACAAAQELLTHGLNGMLVPVNDDLQFISTAVGVADDPNTLARLRQAAPASVAHLSWDAIYDNFVEHLTRVVDMGCTGFHTRTQGSPIKSVHQASA
jgi:glycosyltransferase involved in cell wall biosynthesis